jgi:SPOR domain
VPAYGESQANNAAQPGAANPGSGENLVSREEQPVNIEPAKAPRVVATIPIITGQGSLPPGVGAPAAPAPAPPADMAAQNAPALPAPPPPAPAAPAPVAAATPAPVPAPAAAPAQPAAEPKKIHTVTIKSDQVGAPLSVGGQARPQPHPQAAPRPDAAASPPPAGSNAPLSIVPGSSGGAVAAVPPRRTRVAAAPVAVASSEVGGTAASSGGGYAVQITSQRTAAEAHASFREIRARFPNQLGGREAMIRRADLGAKGTFYRAMVGPFASSEQAAELCSGLKAAGGSCIVQRN